MIKSGKLDSHDSLSTSDEYLFSSDESEPSWLEPELELKDFQLGSARDLFPLSSKSKIGRKQAEILIFKIFFFMLLNHSFQLPKTPFV